MMELTMIKQTMICVLRFVGVIVLLCKSGLVHPVTVNADDDVTQRPSSFATVRAKLFDEFVVANNVQQIQRRSPTLGDEARYEFLANWVLPSDTESRIRLSGLFVDSNQPNTAGLVSPVFDLLDVAKQIGRLRTLQDRVVKIDSKDQRSKSALLLLIDLQLEDFDSAENHFDELYEVVKQTVVRTSHDQWPETLVVWRAAMQHPEFHSILDLLEYLYTTRVNKKIPADCGLLQAHYASLRGQVRARLSQTSAAINSPQFVDWVASERLRGSSVGAGYPTAKWQLYKGIGTHIAGHDDDYLFYRAPLRGNFEVEAELPANGQTQFLLCGRYIGPNSSRGGGLNEGTLRSNMKKVELEPPLSKLEKWCRIRVVHRDNECQVSLNGIHVRTIEATQDTSPWFGFRNGSRTYGTFRDVRITGSPTIPESVSLLALKLDGWFSYYGATVGYEDAAWRLVTDDDGVRQIVGRHDDRLDGTWCERLLRYVRPIERCGGVEYEFFYVPGKMNAHPAVGRTAFVLGPKGLVVHPVTNGAYEETTASPVLESSADGGTELPLVANAWNRMKVELKDSAVRLELNGQLIGTLKLAVSIKRQFGLFHFADRSELRVRNLTMNGDWPTVLPSLNKQQFADQVVPRIDSAMPKSTFRHHFVRDGLDERFIDVALGKKSQIEESDDGVEQTVRSTGQWAQSHFGPIFRMEGDFDASAVVGSMSVSDQKQNGCHISVLFANRYRVDMTRRRAKTEGVSVGWREPAGDGQFRISYETAGTQSMTGTFRVVRRGDRITMLFAENDSRQFRVVSTRTIAGIGKHAAEFSLHGVATNGGTTQIMWKSVELNGDELWHLPDQRIEPQGVLYLLNADGTGLRQLTKEIPDVGSQGAPDWSPDGKLIAFDTEGGRTSDSHTFLVNSDGTNLRDLGVAGMPTFSPDGKRIAFTSFLNGTTIMNTFGGDREMLTEEGWGAQWSPDGKWIAYESRHRTDGQTKRNITIIDVKTKQKLQILKGGDADRYQQIYENMEWSPDSTMICFRGSLGANKYHVGLASIDGSAIKVLLTADVFSDFSWHPTQPTILMSGLVSELGASNELADIPSKHRKGHRLYQYNLESGKLTLVPGQPMNQQNTGMAWSPDGGKIAFISRRFPGPVRWNQNTKP